MEDLPNDTFPVDILISATDRNNLLLDIMNVLGNLKLSVSSFNAKYAGNAGDCLISATII